MFLATWIVPTALGAQVVGYLMLTMLLAFFTTLVPMPALGITPEVVAGQHLPGSGLWVDQPQRVIAFGFLYFAAVGVSELYGHAWLRRATETGTLRA